MPNYRLMLFVDGENFTARGQALLGDDLNFEGSETYYMKDVFLWIPIPHTARHLHMIDANLGNWNLDPAVRSHYYTSLKGSHEDVARVEDRLRELHFEPYVFKRENQRHSKGVDISMTVSALHHAHHDNYDVACLVAGDADFIPLVEEIKWLGKRAMVMFYEDNVAPRLRRAADDFYSITDRMRHAWIEAQRTAQSKRGA